MHRNGTKHFFVQQPGDKLPRGNAYSLFLAALLLAGLANIALSHEAGAAAAVAITANAPSSTPATLPRDGGVAPAVLSPSGNVAQATRAAAAIELNHKLAASIDLDLRHTGVGHVLAAIAAAAQIPIEVQQSVYERLAYGAATRIDSRFHRVSVEMALGQITRELSLRMAIRGGDVVIMPAQPLRLIGRRATWSELRLLGRINQTRLTSFDGNLRQVLKQLRMTPSPALKVDVVPTTAELENAQAMVRATLPASAADVLNTYSHALGCIWYVRHQAIYISSKRDWVKRQLARPVELNFEHAPLQQVIAALAHATGVRFVPAPAVYRKTILVNIASNDGSAQQSLDAIGGITGVGYRIVGRHVEFGTMPTRLGATDPMVGMVQLPLAGGIKLNLLVRQSDMPPAAAENLRLQAKKLLKKISLPAQIEK